MSDVDEMVDYIFEGKEDPGRVFVCRKCGREFRSEKKAPTLCPDCRAKIASETGRIGGRISKAMQAAKKMEAKGRERSFADAQDDKKNAQDDKGTGVRIATASVRTGLAMTKPAPEEDAAAEIRVQTSGTAPEVRPTTLTLGGLRRLLEGQGLDGAEITIDGQPVRSVFVTHYYDLAAGTENYQVELG